MGIFITRYIFEIFIVILSVGHLFNNPSSLNDQERSPLLGSAAQQYGTSTRETQPKKLIEPSAFEGFFEKMKKLLPYIWPHGDLKLQLYVVLCFVLMSFGFLVNLLAPQQIGYIVDNLRTGEFAWMPIVIYVGLKFLQGGVKYIKKSFFLEYLLICLFCKTSRDYSNLYKTGFGSQ